MLNFEEGTYEYIILRQGCSITEISLVLECLNQAILMLWHPLFKLTISAIAPRKSGIWHLRKISTMFVAIMARELRFTSHTKWHQTLEKSF